ncbi:MAG: alpha-glucan family phosphorylase [Elusimicrobia bacterium]|nr:alpha-glucan family phosphorylase [Elusimicrobiota bacterium]MDY5729155.1 alpha-glucan family phosphorylase [Elusimicrobiaceae bacterium]
MKIHSFNVQPNLPENIKFLEELANDMWFTWNWNAILLFVQVDPKLWIAAKRNPKWFLGCVPQKRFEELSKDETFVNNLNQVKQAYYNYKNNDHTWYKEHRHENANLLTAYFSMEYGIGEGLPIYSGGLGMLAGDHIKSASDLGMPIIGVGLFYKQGYVQQVLNREGWQNEEYPDNDWAHMPVERVTKDGKDVVVDIPLGSENVKACIWRVPVGRTSLYLLDTNLQENTPAQRAITEKLYGGDRENRICQEVVLGIGGVKALDAMGITPTVYHINEGHSAFLLFQRIIDIMHAKNLSFAQAREIVWASSVFTTHTPVIAGNEHFDPALVRKYMDFYAREMGISWEDFLALGKETPSSATYCMTVVALRLAAFCNGVAKLHGKVSREMWHNLWPELPVSEVPITSITNGIHSASWISHELNELYRKYLFNNDQLGEVDPSDVNAWEKLADIPDQELWDVHTTRKNKLVDMVRTRLKRQLTRQGFDVMTVKKAAKVLRPDTLTIGFARRFATYKRATLLFKDLNRLDKIVNNPQRPVQFVFAGKAHPADTAGKEFIKLIVGLTQNDPRFKGKIVFVEDYNMNVARYMVQGVDVWLNNPIRPMEASGTSGMKAALNGALALSILDGWWDEVGPCDFGWSIGGPETYKSDEERDAVEAESLYSLIEQEIAPTYYAKENGAAYSLPWLSLMKQSIGHIAPFFNTNRMVKEYYEKFYIPANNYGLVLNEPGKAESVAAWRKKIADNWYRVSVTDITPAPTTAILMGDKVNFKARVVLGGLDPADIQVELYLGQRGTLGDIVKEEAIDMACTGKDGDAYLYEVEMSPLNSGRQDYALRVLPSNTSVPTVLTPLFIRWEE